MIFVWSFPFSFPSQTPHHVVQLLAVEHIYDTDCMKAGKIVIQMLQLVFVFVGRGSLDELVDVVDEERCYAMLAEPLCV